MDWDLEAENKVIEGEKERPLYGMGFILDDEDTKCWKSFRIKVVSISNRRSNV